MDMVVGAMNITSHLCILILPQGVIWKLQLALRKKMGIAIVFMFGILYVPIGHLEGDIMLTVPY